MRPHPAHRPPPPRPARPPKPRPHAATPARAADQAAKLERRRRIKHLRRRRRDLLQDITIALLLAVLGLILTPGLGILAVIEIPVALALIGSLILERKLRNRRAAQLPKKRR